MKKLLVAAIVAAAFCGAPALAADLPVKAPAYKAPPPAALFSWTGWYGGLNAGWIDATGRVNTNATSLTFPSDPETTTSMAAAATSQLNNHPGGFLGGIQFGYNAQLSPTFVAGWETDIQGSSLRGNASTSNVLPTNTTSGPLTGLWTSNITASRGLDYLGTLRARIGVTTTPTFLLYATGGLAYGGVNSNTSMNLAFNGSGVPVQFTSGAFSGVRAGWTAGAGGEWVIAPNWTAKLEYLYYDLGSATYATGGYAIQTGPTSLPGSGLASIATSTTTHFTGNIVRVGLNYKFGDWGKAPVVSAKY